MFTGRETFYIEKRKIKLQQSMAVRFFNLLKKKFFLVYLIDDTCWSSIVIEPFLSLLVEAEIETLILLIF